MFPFELERFWRILEHIHIHHIYKCRNLFQIAQLTHLPLDQMADIFKCIPISPKPLPEPIFDECTDAYTRHYTRGRWVNISYAEHNVHYRKHLPALPSLYTTLRTHRLSFHSSSCLCKYPNANLAATSISCGVNPIKIIHCNGLLECVTPCIPWQLHKQGMAKQKHMQI